MLGRLYKQEWLLSQCKPVTTQHLLIIAYLKYFLLTYRVLGLPLVSRLSMGHKEQAL